MPGAYKPENWPGFMTRVKKTACHRQTTVALILTIIVIKNK